jgi:hypothetical protein
MRSQPVKAIATESLTHPETALIALTPSDGATT